MIVPLTTVSNHFLVLQTQIVLDWQTHRHTHRLFMKNPHFVSVKGKTKKAVAFGLFVYPNNSVRIVSRKLLSIGHSVTVMTRGTPRILLWHHSVDSDGMVVAGSQQPRRKTALDWWLARLHSHTGTSSSSTHHQSIDQSRSTFLMTDPATSLKTRSHGCHMSRVQPLRHTVSCHSIHSLPSAWESASSHPNCRHYIHMYCQLGGCSHTIIAEILQYCETERLCLCVPCACAVLACVSVGDGIQHTP